MNDQEKDTNEEMDCHVTVNDGAYMTCDMIEEEDSKNEDLNSDYSI